MVSKPEYDDRLHNDLTTYSDTSRVKDTRNIAQLERNGFGSQNKWFSVVEHSEYPDFRLVAL